jgi:hypothetical protein
MIRVEDEDGAPVFYASFCPHCGDRSVPYMTSHLRDEGGWTCDGAVSAQTQPDDARTTP